MHHDDISDDLRLLAFEFFYWFSRFEFALKEARFLKSEKVGAKAEADWEGFIAKYSSDYQLTPAAEALIDAKPQRQIVGATELSFGDVCFDPGSSELVHWSNRRIQGNLGDIKAMTITVLDRMTESVH